MSAKQEQKFLFRLGQIVMTPGVSNSFSQIALIPVILLHATGNWGDLSSEDVKANNQAVKDGDRILSSYTLEGTKIWVITEADRSSTTVLLPEEY